MKNLIQKWNSINLIKRIICGLIVGIILGLAIPQASVISILGDLFVGALRGIAPLLVFFLVMSSLCHMGKGQKTNMKFVVVLYLLGNILSALAAVISSRLFPIMLTFPKYKYFRRHSAKRCCRGPQKPSDEHCFQPG